MPVDKKISIAKGTETALVTVVSCGVSLASVYVVKKYGVQMSAEIQGSIIAAITTVMAGLVAGFKNWFDHRKLS